MSKNIYSQNIGVVSPKQTPQTSPIPGKNMIQNPSGGYVFQTSDWDYFDRFLILGTVGGTFYVKESKLTEDGLALVAKCLAADGKRAVDRIVEISLSGRAPKNDSAIAALAIAASAPDVTTRQYAMSKLDRVCRTGTHLFQFAEIVSKMRGWGRSLTSGLRHWYLDKSVPTLAYQAVKYQQREGWSHRDLLRLSHPCTKDNDRNALFHWMAHGKGLDEYPESLRILEGFHKAHKATTAKEIVSLIADYQLTREMIPTEFLSNPEVWEAMLPSMGMTALIRNLANMTHTGLLTDFSEATKVVTARLTDSAQLQKARIHPVSVLIGTLTYQSGHGNRGKHTWTPVGKVVAALNDAFYASFDFTPSTGKNLLLGIDVSGSMTTHTLNNVPGLTARLAAAAIAMTTVRTEPNHVLMAFSNTFIPLNIHARMSLNEVEKTMSNLSFSSTNCALPMLYAHKNKIPVDAFAVYTDNETNYGHIHPCQALQQYRNTFNSNAKLIVVSLASQDRSIADPADPGTLDIVGFDAAVPTLIADFITGGVKTQAVVDDIEN